jgi:hypothetical protein
VRTAKKARARSHAPPSGAICQGDGRCTLADLDGDQAYLTWQSSGPLVRESFIGTTYDCADGTGKYKEIKEHNTFVAHAQVNWLYGPVLPRDLELLTCLVVNHA